MERYATKPTPAVTLRGLRKPRNIPRVLLNPLASLTLGLRARRGQRK